MMSRRSIQARRLLTAAMAVGLLASVATPASAADPKRAAGASNPIKVTIPKGLETGALVTKLPSDLIAAKGPVSVFVRLKTKGAADAYNAALPSKKAAKAAALAARASTNKSATTILGVLKGKDKTARELFRTTNAIPGLAVIADAAKIRTLAVRADVVSIARLVPKKLENAHAAVLTKALNAWINTGLLGNGIRVGIIDSGIDYTHANFGGAGTKAAYDAIDPTASTPAFPSAKVVGGTDLAGEQYDASSDDPAQYTPDPDNNPLDCDDHGSHVAGTAAGYGVASTGATFTGNYRALNAAKLGTMRIGPGMAPQASLYAIKVFGCPGGGAGSTNLVSAGIDWALDPNDDGDMSDHLDVVNISIGGDFASPDDPEGAFVQKAVDNNMLAVISAGNAGDLFDSAGSPGNTPAALTVASSQDNFNLLDAIQVTSPAAIAGTKAGQYSVAFDYAGLNLTKPVVKMTQATNLDGCAPFNSADTAIVTGKFVWLEWDDNDATRRCGSAGRSANAVTAGAAGAVFSSTLEHFGAGITGSAVVPVFQLTAAGTTALRPALNAGTLVVRMAVPHPHTFPPGDPAIEDQISDFSSRGTRTPGVKPDVTAPGSSIVSTARGTGNKQLSISGTSMASPHVAGIAALLRQYHPTWDALEIKAAILDTANHDLFSQPDQGDPIYAPNRVGTGRVDALAAVTTKVLTRVTDSPETVSVGFGVVEANAATTTLTKSISIINKGWLPATYHVAYDAINTMPGVSYTLDRSSVTVPAHAQRTVRITLKVVRNSLRKTIDQTLNPIDAGFGIPRDALADASGRVIFTPTAGATVPLRVAVYAAPKPTADITLPADMTIAKNGSSFLTLDGRGVAQGSGDESYVSLVSVMELGATSPKLVDCGALGTTNCALNVTARGGDIRYVGAASNAVAEKAAGSPENSMIGFGFAMWNNWYNIGSNTIPFVDIDVDGDETPDFETFVLKPDASDLILSATVDLATGDLVDLELINTVTSDVDTNVFDTNVIMLPVFVDALGIDPTDNSHRITYAAGVAGYYTAPADTLIDSTGAVSYDVLKPGLWAEGADTGLLFVASPGTGFDVHRNNASLNQDPLSKLLVLNFHNRSGRRALIVTVN